MDSQVVREYRLSGKIHTSLRNEIMQLDGFSVFASSTSIIFNNENEEIHQVLLSINRGIVRHVRCKLLSS